MAHQTALTHARVVDAHDDLLLDLEHRRGLQQVAAFRRAVRECPDLVFEVRSRGDLYEAEAGPRIGLALSLEDAELLGSDPGLIEVFHDLGVRMVSLRSAASRAGRYRTSA